MCAGKCSYIYVTFPNMLFFSLDDIHLCKSNYWLPEDESRPFEDLCWLMEKPVYAYWIFLILQSAN